MNRSSFRVPALACVLLLAVPCWAAPKPPAGGGAKPLPPPGVALPAAAKTELEAGVAKLGDQIASLKRSLAEKPGLLALLPDVQIYYNAVYYPLTYDEFYVTAPKAPSPEADKKAMADAIKRHKAALEAGMERAKLLGEGKAPWVLAGGPRGYLSKVDGSVQPYLLAVPKGFDPKGEKKIRVDLFCHGRGEDLTELKFISGKMPEVTDKLLVHPYGRYCCANKFAGEIDTMEILDSLRKQYPVDEQRIVMTGFSMGGAAVWHFSVHYADLWCAASPGAGFCETKIYQKLAEKGELEATPWWQQKLWHLYDCPDYAVNLWMCPTIAYAGEIDPQRQSGDIMEAACKELGFKLQRIVGPKTAHKYEPEAKKELDKRLDEYAAKGRNDVPEVVKFETWTLRYNHMFWVRLNGLDKHWERAKVIASITDPAGLIGVKTQNVAAITLTFAAGQAPFAVGSKPKIILDSTELGGPRVGADKSWEAHYVKVDGIWQEAALDDFVVAKRPGLQGPVDDAFMGHFVFVSPTGKALNEKTGAWAKGEESHAIAQWHRIFRGEAKVIKDSEVTDAEIAASNLVLWGDPSSNALLAKIADKLPIKWDGKTITAGSKTFDAAHHAAILIYPNPLNPTKYVVLNSGFTFREESNGTNSRQVAKLPDYAVIDLDTPPSASAPGGIVDAGFFDEKWQLQAGEGK